MPLRDHFRPPLSKRLPWEQFHGGWPAGIVRELNKVLPPQYRAGPRVHRAWQTVDSFVNNQSGRRSSGAGECKDDTIVAAWAPAKPTLAVDSNVADFDNFEVRVYDASRDQRLVSVVQLISPGNKDCPENRSQFTAKCAALLRQGVSVVLVDIVTERSANLYADLLDLACLSDPSLGGKPPAIYAVACRWLPHGARGRLETWNHELKPGLPLPRLPLWLTEELAIPLDLEASYEQTCRDFRVGCASGIAALLEACDIDVVG